MNNSKSTDRQATPDAPRPSYEPPILRKLGHMAAVTQKSGGSSDGAAARKA